MTCPVCGRACEIQRGRLSAHGAERPEHQRDARSMLCRGSTPPPQPPRGPIRAPMGPLFSGAR